MWWWIVSFGYSNHNDVFQYHLAASILAAAAEMIPLRNVQAWLGIPIFLLNFWDPHWKQNSNSVFDSKDSSQKSFLNSAVEKSQNWNADSEIK
jgi:hypothetical protein